jgi:serine/threonine protein kinase/Flp pilus assembly protein TadD
VQNLIDSWVDSLRTGASADVDLRSPVPASSWGEARVPDLDEPGERFLNFRLVSELGRGAFGRVYLARQDDLARRLVVLKVSPEVQAESHNLAQLQHTHIVPVYSIHQAGPLQAVCMPYFGSATLADVLRDLQRQRTPPTSGKGLVNTIQDRVSRTRASLEREGGHHAAGPLPPVVPSARLRAEVGQRDPTPGEVPPTLRRLEGLSYVDAVLWLGECLAHGLAHAHERGILHRDLKPANILLTDDGQPMLLDFNLSADLKGEVSRARVGGTLPYMAPEHLACFAGLPAPFPPGANAPAVADARSDVYSLGVVLSELFTGRAPFQDLPFGGGNHDLLARMIQNRLGKPPRVRPFNRSVSPAVESILRHCLEPDPARRYQSARQLAEDLECQRTHRPLAHAREPSPRERAAKWVRRNRKRAALSAGLFAGVLILCLGWGLTSHAQRLRRIDAAATLSAFRAEAEEAHLLLAARPEDAESRREGLRSAYHALARYRVLDRPAWRARPAVRRLPPEAQDALAQTVGELLLLAAGNEETDQRARLIGLAGACFPPDEAPRSLAAHLAELADVLGDRAGARARRREAERAPVRNAMDHYLLARESVRAGEHARAVKHLREAVRLEPNHFAAWFLLGNCCLDGTVPGLGERQAVECYTTCTALRPLFYGSFYNRGLARLRLNGHADAEADFSAALELRPHFPAGYLRRGLAREGQGKLREALADLTRASHTEEVPGKLWFARARVRRALGDKAGAEHDEKEGLLRPPGDEESCVLRGVWRVAADLHGALEDFRAAVRFNPRSLSGRFNQAVLLAERLGQPEEAIRLLDEAVRQHPHVAAPRVSRGVLQARLGRRAAAHQDGRQAVRLAGNNREVLYQAACIYAQTSRSHSEDRHEAFRFLARALQLGFGHDHLAADADLQPLRPDPRFRKLLQGVEAFRAGGGRGL